MAEHVYADPKRTNPIKQTVEAADKEAAPHSTQSSSLSELQRVLGNQGLQRLLAQRKIQAKLTVGAADDQYEQEADRVAHEVMSAASAPENMQREAVEEDEMMLKRADVQREAVEEDEMMLKRADIQRSNADLSGSFDVDDGVENQIGSMKGGGQALPGETQSFFESRFGQDFGDVRVHASSDADALNRSIGARAFTNGSDIFVRSNEYSPDSTQGRELLAHELTHVVQQTGGKPVQAKRDEQ
jgi:hypothetical protein